AYNNQPDNKKYVVFKKTAEVALPSQIFTFIEIFPDSICRPMFGMNMDSQAIYHTPASFHGQVSNMAFADGHAEVHKWRDPNFNNPKPPPPDWHNHGGIMIKASSKDDLQWLKDHATVRR
ncbi:MAG TPA: hypothetical protein VHH73_20345, partial [Verrucomicrobiae bacterium]|nr:hypothetical protein [Verrucomicrobiae bacterium]